MQAKDALACNQRYNNGKIGLLLQKKRQKEGREESSRSEGLRHVPGRKKISKEKTSILQKGEGARGGGGGGKKSETVVRLRTGGALGLCRLS